MSEAEDFINSAEKLDPMMVRGIDCRYVSLDGERNVAISLLLQTIAGDPTPLIIEAMVPPSLIPSLIKPYQSKDS